MDQATTAIKEDFNILNEKLVIVEQKAKANENILKQKSAAVKQISHLKIVISNLTNQLHKGTPIQQKVGAELSGLFIIPEILVPPLSDTLSNLIVGTISSY